MVRLLRVSMHLFSELVLLLSLQKVTVVQSSVGPSEETLGGCTQIGRRDRHRETTIRPENRIVHRETYPKQALTRPRHFL